MLPPATGYFLRISACCNFFRNVEREIFFYLPKDRRALAEAHYTFRYSQKVPLFVLLS